MKVPPATRLKLHEYREQWKDLVLIGGIPAQYLIPDQTSEEEMYQYLDYLFKAVAPGIKYIPGISDAVSSLTDFDRLRKFGNYIQDRGKFPLAGGKVLDIFQGGYTVMDLAPAKFTHAEDVLGELQRTVIKGDKDEVCENVIKCLTAKVDGRSILREGMITAMTYVGDAFSRADMYIPEMLMAANAMEAGVKLLKPALTSSLTQQTKAKVILGTVYGDLHDIGKNLVSIMLKGTGMEVIDLGINVSTDAFIRCVVDEKPYILALSVLLTTTMPQMKIVIDSLEEIGIRDHIKIIVGGAPVTKNFAKSIGVDGYAETAGSAAALVRNIL
jgi:5-methyltetrahydrofolate--homocysteine methyltransferase